MDGNSGEGRNQNGGQERIAQAFQTGTAGGYGFDAGGQPGSSRAESIYDGRDREAGSGISPGAGHHDDGLDGLSDDRGQAGKMPAKGGLEAFYREYSRSLRGSRPGGSPVRSHDLRRNSKPRTAGSIYSIPTRFRTSGDEREDSGEGWIGSRDYRKTTGKRKADRDAGRAPGQSGKNEDHGRKGRRAGAA